MWWQKRYSRSQRFQPRLEADTKRSSVVIEEVEADAMAWGRDGYDGHVGDARQPKTPIVHEPPPKRLAGALATMPSGRR
eukprot:14014857-Alexandrium_andersonii.AAC.1